MLWNCAACAVALATLCLVAPAGAFAWGANGHKLISNKAVDTLPPELRPFFEANRNFIVQHSTDPFDALAKNPVAERRNRILLLDRYGRFPFESLPRDYKAALAKFGKAKLEANGVLPWQIGVYNEKLTNALRTRNWEEVRLLAALVSHYVAEAHDPFSTTENFDGKLSGQPGVNQRFGASLGNRFSPRCRRRNSTYIWKALSSRRQWWS